MLSGHAFNAMLKTLEEPPEHMKFILATTDPQKIPVTVLSRCLQFNLKQMPPAAIVAHLERILSEEKIAFEAEALALIARAAAGSMRDALSLLDQAIAHGGGRVARARRGRDARRDRPGLPAARCSSASRRGDAAGAVDDRRRDAGAQPLVRCGARRSREPAAQLALAQSGAGRARRRLPERARLAALAGRLDPESVQLYYQIALQGREDLPLAPDEHGGFVMTLLRMLAFRPGRRRRRRIAARRRRKPRRSRSAGCSSRRPRPRGDWPRARAAAAVTGAARELARNAELQRREGDVFELVVPKAKAYLAERSYTDKLKAALEQHLGARGARSRCRSARSAGASAAALEAGEREARRAAAAQSVQADGFVQGPRQPVRRQGRRLDHQRKESEAQ